MKVKVSNLKALILFIDELFLNIKNKLLKKNFFIQLKNKISQSTTVHITNIQKKSFNICFHLCLLPLLPQKNKLIWQIKHSDQEKQLINSKNTTLLQNVQYLIRIITKLLLLQ